MPSHFGADYYHKNREVGKPKPQRRVASAPSRRPEDGSLEATRYVSTHSCTAAGRASFRSALTLEAPPRPQTVSMSASFGTLDWPPRLERGSEGRSSRSTSCVTASSMPVAGGAFQGSSDKRAPWTWCFAPEVKVTKPPREPEVGNGNRRTSRLRPMDFFRESFACPITYRHVLKEVPSAPHVGS
eukprot:TRINITY_DN4188_c11_g1_i1.p2 TRINITY_DN4188_c11_g1~~TRINITY_DN4188_c11_g1_i1.p2  ORF type:complete len:185 (+),score=33.77 TRINITY_DN4188_c11_g1_i1:261-815(+)